MDIFLSQLRSNFEKIKDFFKRNDAISFLLVFSFFFLIFTFVYMKINVLSFGDDHYFHFRFAERLVQNGFFDSFRNFKSIYFTQVAQGQYFIYYNFLFYLITIPFSFITPLFLGIKLYAIMIISIIGVVLFLFIKKINVKYPFLWSVGFFAIIGLGSFWRLFLSRPYVFAPVFILLLILAIHKNKYFWIFIITFLYLFWHTATFLLPVFVGILYFFIYALYERKYNWKLVLCILGGTISSVFVVSLINSGFFQSIYSNVLDLLKGIILGNKINIPEGIELYPRNLFDFLNENIFLLIMFISASVIHLFTYFQERVEMFNFDSFLKQRKIITMVFFILSSVFFVAISIISSRFADFFIFFAWLFIVLVFSEISSQIKFNKQKLGKFVGYAIMVCLIYLFSNSALQLNEIFASRGNRPESFSEVGNYLSKNLKKGDIVFNVSWDWFSQLYYYAPNQNYVVGLEPKMTYLYSPRIYWLWSNISKGYICEDEKCPEKDFERNKSFKKRILFSEWTKKEGNKIAENIVNEFKSHYIVSSKGYYYLNSVLDNNEHFKKVVDSNDFYYVYKISD